MKFTLDRMIQKNGIEGQTSPRAGPLGPLKEVQAVDKYTVRLVLWTPRAILPAMLPFQEIISKSLAQRNFHHISYFEYNGHSEGQLANQSWSCQK